MKHLIASTILLFSAQTFAGGSETKPIWSASWDGNRGIETPTIDIASFENTFKDKATVQPFIVNGVVINIDSKPDSLFDYDTLQSEGEGGVESQPIPPFPFPFPKIQDTVPTEANDMKNIKDLWSLPSKGGSETVAVPIGQMAAAAAIKPIEIHSIRYVGETATSVVLQINQTNQFIKMKDAEVFKVQNLKDMIGESVNNNSSWIKTN